jgi:hypothetical protein
VNLTCKPTLIVLLGVGADQRQFAVGGQLGVGTEEEEVEEDVYAFLHFWVKK